MMIDRLAGNAALKDSVRLMLGSSRLTHSVLLVGETGLGAGYAARCVAGATAGNMVGRAGKLLK